VERVGWVTAVEDDLVPREGPAAGDREQRAQCVIGHIGEQLPLHVCDEFDTSSVANANDAARRSSYGVCMTLNIEGGVMKRKGSRRLIKHLGLAFAVAAFAAPATQAMPMVVDSGGPVSSPIAYADDLHSSLPSRAGDPVVIQRLRTADDLHSSLPLRASNESKVIKDNYAPINTQARPDLIPPVSQAVPDSSSFDWSVATIGGIVSLFGLMLLGVGVLLAGRHSRRSRLAAT
jgi:hypothetical protein